MTSTEAQVEWALGERDAAFAALAAGDPGTARGRAQAALDALRPIGAGVEAETASVLLALGEVENAIGDLASARRVLDRAAALAAVPGGGSDPDRVRLWCQVQTRLGDLERCTGDLGAADARLCGVLARAGAAFGEDDDTVVAALVALGIVHKYACRYDDAEAAYRRALDILETRARQSGTEPERADLANLFHNLGGINHARGTPEPGITWAERGLALQEAALGPEHPDVARDLNALAALYQLAGRLPDAATAAARALTIFLTHLGPEHYEVGMAAANLAAVRADQGADDEAIELGRRALGILTAVLGPDHPEVGLTEHNLGVALLDAGHPADARAALTRALAVLTPALPAGHPQLAATAAALASAATDPSTLATTT